MSPDGASPDRRQFLRGLAVSAGLAAAGCTTTPTTPEPPGSPTGATPTIDTSVTGTWRVGTPPQGFQSHIAATALARTLADHESRLSLQVTPLSGAEESVRLLGRGDLDAAHGSNLLGAAAYHSTHPIGGIDFSGDKAVAQRPLQSFSYMDLRTYFLTLDETIETTADLAGKRVGAGPPGAQWLTAITFKAIGILDEVDLVSTSFQDLPFALREGRVDAAIATAGSGLTAPAFIQSMRNYDVTVVVYDEDHLSRLRSSSMLAVRPVDVDQFFEKDLSHLGELPTATQPFQFLLNPSVEDGLAYEFVKQAFEHREDVQSQAAFLRRFAPGFALDGLSTEFPVHPGVAAYYRRHGHWRDDLTVP